MPLNKDAREMAGFDSPKIANSSTHPLPEHESEEGYGVSIEGDGATLDYKVYITKNNKKISPFHNIPYLNQDRTYNMIVEIPKDTKKKMEINKEVELNPLTYDKAKKDPNAVREVVYKAKGADKPGYPFHYGAIPQTWEHAGEKDDKTGKYGDNDPIDIFDISPQGRTTGEIRKVKVLGAFAMIDGGETDWKIIAIDSNDEDYKKYNKLSDIPSKILETIEDFLTNYKTVDQSDPSKVDDGKKNEFAEKKLFDVDEIKEIIKETHKAWNRLITKTEEVVYESKKREDEDKEFSRDAIKNIKLSKGE